jgi:hypothetical protein
MIGQLRLVKNTIFQIRKYSFEEIKITNSQFMYLSSLHKGDFVIVIEKTNDLQKKNPVVYLLTSWGVVCVREKDFYERTEIA